MANRKAVNERTYSYKQLRTVAELSKKEADNWVRSGVIKSELPFGRRRRVYTFESLMEGWIAKQLADFSSRELLPKMMKGFRSCLKDHKIDINEVAPDPSIPRLMIQIYTRISHELMPGGGIRGVIVYAKRFEPRPEISKGIYLIVDLNQIAIDVYYAIGQFD